MRPIVPTQRVTGTTGNLGCRPGHDPFVAAVRCPAFRRRRSHRIPVGPTQSDQIKPNQTKSNLRDSPLGALASRRRSLGLATHVPPFDQIGLNLTKFELFFYFFGIEEPSCLFLSNLSHQGATRTDRSEFLPPLEAEFTDHATRNTLQSKLVKVNPSKSNLRVASRGGTLCQNDTKVRCISNKSK